MRRDCDDIGPVNIVARRQMRRVAGDRIEIASLLVGRIALNRAVGDDAVQRDRRLDRIVELISGDIEVFDRHRRGGRVFPVDTDIAIGAGQDIIPDGDVTGDVPDRLIGQHDIG